MFWLLGVTACFAALYALSKQHKVIEELRATNQVLRAEQKQLTSNLSAHESDEVLRLRKEVTELREQIVTLRIATNKPVSGSQ